MQFQELVVAMGEVYVAFRWKNHANQHPDPFFRIQVLYVKSIKKDKKNKH